MKLPSHAEAQLGIDHQDDRIDFTLTSFFRVAKDGDLWRWFDEAGRLVHCCSDVLGRNVTYVDVERSGSVGRALDFRLRGEDPGSNPVL